MSMNVSITDSLEEFVQAQVKSGMYASASEVVRSGLRLLREREADIHCNIAISLEQIENGQYVEFDDSYIDNMKGRVKNRLSNSIKHAK